VFFVFLWVWDLQGSELNNAIVFVTGGSSICAVSEGFVLFFCWILFVAGIGVSYPLLAYS